MNLSPDNRTTLESLLAGLSAGVSGEQAAPILAATLQAQAAQQDARKARYQQMATDVVNLAGQGQTYGSVGNYIDTMTQAPGIPGKFQGLLDSAFANGDVPQSLQPIDYGPNSQYSHGLYAQDFGNPQAGPLQSPDIQAQMQSPLYTQNPASAGAYNMMEGGAGELLTSPDQARMSALSAMPEPPKPTESDMVGETMAGINKLRALGMSDQEIAVQIQQDPEHLGVILNNPGVFINSAPEITNILMPGAL